MENQLEGTLPPEWSNMEENTYFGLYSNKLTGTLPPSWGKAKSLTTIFLGNNQLSGRCVCVAYFVALIDSTFFSIELTLDHVASSPYIV
jgi:hypothetical protein